MTYPVYAEKHPFDGVVTPEEMLAHRRRGGRLPAIEPPRGAVICLERGLPEQMRRRIRVRHVGRLLGDLYSVRSRRGRVIVLANFGLGAPAAAAQAEELIALGARRIVSIALCGGLQPEIAAGDVIVAQAAIRDEGTSHHYLPAGRTVAADPSLAARLVALLSRDGTPPRAGTVWSTDAPYRETAQEIALHGRGGALGVDMEAAAILAVAEVRGVEAGAVLVAGDNLAGGTWRPPARLQEMRDSLRRAYACAIEAADDP